MTISRSRISASWIWRVVCSAGLIGVVGYGCGGGGGAADPGRYTGLCAHLCQCIAATGIMVGAPAVAPAPGYESECRRGCEAGFEANQGAFLYMTPSGGRYGGSTKTNRSALPEACIGCLNAVACDQLESCNAVGGACDGPDGP